MPHIATVEFVPSRNDSANSPSSLTSMLFSANIAAQLTVIELSSGKADPVFCGWTGLSSAKANTIELDPTFATSLGLIHGQEIKISVKPKVPEAHSVLLEPVSVGDWEIVETHAAFLEAFMINQVRAVSLNKFITVFPSSTSLAVLKVVRIDPDLNGQPVARLSPECEVIIAPKAHEKPARTTVNGVASNSGSSASSHQQPAVTVIRRSTVHPYLPNLGTRKFEIHGRIRGISSGDKVRISIAVPSVLSSSENAASSENEEIPHAKKVIATYVAEEHDILGSSYGLECALNVQDNIGVQVVVTSSPKQQNYTSISATIRPFTSSTSSTSTKLSLSKTEAYLSADQSDLDVVCKGTVVAPHPQISPLGGVVDTEFPKFGHVSKLKIGSEVPLAKSKKMRDLAVIEENKSSRHPIVGQDKSLMELETAAENANGILLYGSRGCGKSVVLHEIANRLKHKHVHIVTFKCSIYMDKALPTVREALHKVSYEAMWMAPSVILFDDLDKLVPAQQEYNGDSGRQQQIAEIFCSILSPLIASGRVSVIAAAQDQTAIHSFLLASHLLETVVHLRSPDKESREQILRAAVDADKDLSPASDLDLSDVVAETEGYQPGDLWILVERLVSMSALNDIGDKNTMEVTTDSFIAATTDFTPASSRGVKLEKPAVKWSEIGGMRNAKNLVSETLEWPTKYAPIFAKCPLRLRSGLSFYGFPGCGKTMLASAIASKTGLNFISVKGPEILNKYIGASEQSVRELFDRAQAAKPCVLFFDEFDSIAPKRGHDATGVTDRVVNQMLTQMDGAEGLDGVYVLAATSRPDLIDSALLRPGRSDKSVLCDMPDVEARLDILTRAAKKLASKPGLDMQEFAEKTRGYSGADLQALVYNAYLKGVHKSLAADAADESNDASKSDAQSDDIHGFQVGLGDLESSKAYLTNSASADEQKSAASTKSGNSTVAIGNEEMHQASVESKPSISPKELERFASIYSEFSTDRNGEMPPGTSSNEVGGRVTLQ